jgi:hypothetical protein
MSVTIRVFIVALLLSISPARADNPAALLEQFDAYPHVIRVGYSVAKVADYEIGLGAMRKVRGVWGFKDSERQSGELTRYTWQVIDGFTANELLAEMESALVAADLLFACDGRSCGKGAQWANRVFGERLLYGRDDEQRYRAYGNDDEPGYRLLLFSSARTADRQHLHAELLKISP